MVITKTADTNRLLCDQRVNFAALSRIIVFHFKIALPPGPDILCEEMRAFPKGPKASMKDTYFLRHGPSR